MRHRHHVPLAVILLLVLTALGVALLSHAPTARLSTPTPVLTDPSHRYVIGCGFDPATSAPEVCDESAGGVAVGVYVDDTTPLILHWITLAVARYPLVLVGEAPGQWQSPPYCSLPRVLCLREWYPYESGAPAASWGPMPPARGYILQKRFSFTGQPVQRWQTNLLLREARAMRPRPRLILLY